MNKIKQIEYAFEIERASYLRTIALLKDELGHTRCDDGLKERYELAKNKIDELLVANENLQVMNGQLKAELEQRGKKLSATQYKEYKRLKQKEYTERWKKKKAKASK